MSKQARVIILAALTAATLAVGAAVFAAEEPGEITTEYTGTPIPTYRTGEGNEFAEKEPEPSVKDERESNTAHEIGQDEKLVALEEKTKSLGERISDLQKQITNYLTVITIIIGAIQFGFGILITIISYRQIREGRAQRKDFEYEIQLIRGIEEDGRRLLNETRVNAERAQEYKDQAKEELAIIRKDKEEEVEAATDELPPISEAEKEKDLVEKILKKYPDLKRNTDFLYEAAIKGDITDPRVLDNIAESLYYNGKYEGAINIIDLLINRKPNEAGLYYNKGLALQTLKDYDAAIKSYEKAISLAPDMSEAYNNYGNVLARLGKYKEAIHAYDKAIEADPLDGTIYYNKGRILSELKRYDEAITFFEKAIALNPDYAEAMNNKGNALSELGDEKKAVESYREAIRKKPNNPRAYVNLGNSLYNLDDYPGSLEAYNKAIEFDPKFADAYSNKVGPLIKNGKFKEATESASIAIELNPEYASAYFNRACAFGHWGKRDEMVADLKTAIELDEVYREKAKTDPDFDPFRDDPAFRRIAYPEEFKGEEKA